MNIPLTPEQQLEEIQRCTDDPVYFLETYVLITSPKIWWAPFKLNHDQKKMIGAFVNGKETIVRSTSRQRGVTAALCGYVLWYTLFHSDKMVLLASYKLLSAKYMLEVIRGMYDSIPRWLAPGYHKWNTRMCTLANGSGILPVAATQHSGLFMRVDLVVCDDFAYIGRKRQRWFWNSVGSYTRGWQVPCIIANTEEDGHSIPYGEANLFSGLWKEAIDGNSGAIAVRIR